MATKSNGEQPAYDPKAMFSSADVFSIGAHVLGEELRQNPHLIKPHVVLHALSLEIFLKCLLTLEGKTYGGTHTLTELFQKLSDENKARIKELHVPALARQQAAFDHIRRNANDDPSLPKTITFDFLLATSSRAFVTMRYLYEGRDTNRQGWLAGEIVHSVRARIVELRPEWANLPYGFVQPEDGRNPT